MEKKGREKKKLPSLPETTEEKKEAKKAKSKGGEQTRGPKPLASAPTLRKTIAKKTGTGEQNGRPTPPGSTPTPKKVQVSTLEKTEAGRTDNGTQNGRPSPPGSEPDSVNPQECQKNSTQVAPQAAKDADVVAGQKEAEQEGADLVLNASQDDRNYFEPQPGVIPRNVELARREEFKQKAEANRKRRLTSNFVPEKEAPHKGEGGWVSQATGYTMENLEQYFKEDYIKEAFGNQWCDRDAGSNLGEKRLLTVHERLGIVDGMNLKGFASLNSEDLDMEDETVSALLGVSADTYKAERLGVRVIPGGVSKAWLGQAITWPNKILVDGVGVENWKGKSFARLAEENP